MMYTEIAPVAPVEGRPVSDETFDMVVAGRKAAIDAARTYPLNPQRIDFVMRNLPALFAAPNGINGATLRSLSTETISELYDVAAAGARLLDPAVMQERAQAHLDAEQPQTRADAVVSLFRSNFSAVYNTVTVGQNQPGGYRAEDEAVVRDLAVINAHAFGAVYTELEAMGHPIATDPGMRDYFMGNINAASQPDSVPPAANGHQADFVEI